MTAVSKLEARRRAVEAQRRANEVRAQQDRANADDATAVRALIGRLQDVDEWQARRVAQSRQQAEAEAQQAGAAAITRKPVHRSRTCGNVARDVGGYRRAGRC